ncbi:hypothetical protein DRJ17_04115 [Candidatus Woesearchaeota archaeon]|nr:MAG: hypothetical protein DRJ17_04115 [Candidatus Woesearchaeota archaeon]
MVILQHIRYKDLKVILFTTLPPHLLVSRFENPEEFYKKSTSFLIDNDVYAILRKYGIGDPKRVYKLAVKKILQRLQKVRKDSNIYIIAPDYPFDVNVNYQFYQQFKKEYPFIFKNHVVCYVAHGYYSSKIPEDVQIVAIPFNKLSTIDEPGLSGKSVCRLGRPTIKHILNKTVEHIVSTVPGCKIHLLGTTKRTLQAIFGEISCYEYGLYKNIHSIDTTAWHLAPNLEIKKEQNGKYMIGTHPEIFEKWFNEWIKGLPFKLM